MTEADRAPLRLAEIVAALSLGIDLGFGQPMEHVLRQCRIALRIAEQLRLDDDDRAAIYYAALLVNVGCHSDAHEQARWFGDDITMKRTKYDYEPFSAAGALAMLRMIGSGGTPLHRIRVGLDLARNGRRELDQMIAVHARLAAALGRELDLSGAALDGLRCCYERWDGKGMPGDCSGDAVPIASRVAQLAEFAEVAHRSGGPDAALEMARRRAGTQFDPSLVAVLCRDSEKIFHGLDDGSSWSVVIENEPALAVQLDAAQADAALAAVARYVDLKVSWLTGHSLAVAELARRAAAISGMGETEAQQLFRAGLVQGFGRLGVSNGVWDKVAPLTTGDRERVRTHPYLTERMLEQSPALAPIGRIAGQYRERLDGSGYPRGLHGSAIARSARMLAVADAYQAMREERPHRPARSAAEAEAELHAEVRAGRLDEEAVRAVLSAAGHRVAKRGEGPDGLTARELDVLRLVAVGRTNKEIASELFVAPKTVGNHIERIYTKIGVQNRAGASLYAMQRGILPEEQFQG